MPVDVDESLVHYLRPGDVKNGYELFGFPDPVARSLAAARCAPVASSLGGMTFVGLYSGIMALERELTALGGCVREVFRARGRLSSLTEVSSIKLSALLASWTKFVYLGLRCGASLCRLRKFCVGVLNARSISLRDPGSRRWFRIESSVR